MAVSNDISRGVVLIYPRRTEGDNYTLGLRERLVTCSNGVIVSINSALAGRLHKVRVTLKRDKATAALDDKLVIRCTTLGKGSKCLCDRCGVEEYAYGALSYLKFSCSESRSNILGKTATYGKDFCAVVYLALQFKFFYLSAKLHLEAILLQSWQCDARGDHQSQMELQATAQG